MTVSAWGVDSIHMGGGWCGYQSPSRVMDLGGVAVVQMLEPEKVKGPVNQRTFLWGMWCQGPNG
jgi:hypothetical protein